MNSEASDATPAPLVGAGRWPQEGGTVSTGVAIIGFLLCFLAGSAVMWGYDSHRVKAGARAEALAGASGGSWSDGDALVPVSSEDPVWGRRDAPVTVVVFSDFQCPFCSRVEPTLDQVKQTYGPDKVRIVWKNQPIQFHENAKPAAEAAQTVFALKGSDAFWKFHHLAFQNQKDLRPESYERWAREAGVDPGKFKSELASGKAAKKVEADAALATKIGATATPAFRVNGAELAGAQPFERFKAVIDKELQKATAKIASGTARDRVYVETTKENYRPPAPPAPRPDEPAADTKTVWKVPVGNSPVLGKKDAIVTIVEFSDFQCPYCKKVEEPLQKVRETYGDKVRIVWKHDPLPFHPRAEPASELALVARAERGDKGFWEAHDKLFASQPKLEDADLDRIAGELRLDVAKVHAAIKDKRYAKEIEADVEASDDVKVEGTPHFFVNGRRLVGASPFEAFQKIIDEEIAAFEGQTGTKVAAAGWYDHLMKSAKGPPELDKRPIPPVPAGAPWRGAANAKVVIQEWSDFQCPFCGRVEGTLAEVMKNYGDKVKLVWRDKPLSIHADAPLAAEAAREALRQKGPDGFWKLHDKMMQNQQRLKRDDLESYGKETGLDTDKLRSALDARTHKPAVDVDDKSGNDVGLAGTPAFLVNGYFIDGAQPYAKFKKIIDRALAEAK